MTDPAEATGPQLTDQEEDARRRAEERRGLPEFVGPYRIVRLIDEGSSGRVYEAHDPNTNRRVALKWLRPDAPQDMRDMFIGEAQNAARVEHPNVCPIYGTGVQDERPYIVMRFYGGTLSDRLRAEVPPPVPTVLRWVRDIANGLAALHAASLVHRDVKPSNVLMDGRTGTVALTDFGLAVPHDLDSGTGVAGTPMYMSPEQWENGPITPKSDVFNLGVVLYRALTGTHPFGEGHRFDIGARVLRDEPDFDRVRQPNHPPEVVSLLREALEKSPSDRPTAREFADRIDAYLLNFERRAQPRGARLALQLSATAPDGTDPARLQSNLLELYNALNDYHLALGGSGLKPVSPRPGAGE